MQFHCYNVYSVAFTVSLSTAAKGNRSGSKFLEQ